MAKVKWDQVNFTRGELDPRVQVRTDWPSYYKAAKQIRNCVCIPQGGTTRRWGTEFVLDLGELGIDPSLDSDAATSVEITAMPYDGNIIYLLVWTANELHICLENKRIATINTQYAAEDIANLRTTIALGRLIVVDGNHIPTQLKRSASPGVPITGADEGDGTLSAALGYPENTVLPVRFNGTTLPATKPKVYPNRDYFIRTVGVGVAAEFKIFRNIEDANNNINWYEVRNMGTTAAVLVSNVWTLTPINIVHYPSYDFNTNYLSWPAGNAAITFTPSGIGDGMNTEVTITCANAPAGVTIFNSGHVGGVFGGNGGLVRIKSITNANVAVGTSIGNRFLNTLPISGDLCFLGEVAWSDIKGWPRCATVFQNRLVFCGSALIPNGKWLSVINDLYDFDNSDIEDDNSIASYPSSGDVSYIKSVTSARSLLTHTNSANYSTPVQNEIAITPRNFLMIEHNKFGVSDIAPVFIDNQLFFVDGSGNNVITMAWDFIQGNYVTNSVSISASSLIDNPVDMTAFTEPKYLDGFYVLFINSDGTMCVLQTLKEEEISAFSLMDTNTYPGGQKAKSYYKKVTSTQNRCWVLTQRTIMRGAAQTERLFLEEISFNYYTDCSTTRTLDVADTTVDGLDYLNGQTVKVVAVDPFTKEQYVLQDRTVVDGSITIEIPSIVVKVGLAYQSKLVPLPPVVPEQPGMLFNPTHLRTIYISYYNTIGATVQGYGMPTQNIGEVLIGVPLNVNSGNGVFTYTPMFGWEGTIQSDLEIIQEQPLPMTITGLSYVMDT